MTFKLSKSKLSNSDAMYICNVILQYNLIYENKDKINQNIIFINYNLLSTTVIHKPTVNRFVIKINVVAPKNINYKIKIKLI